ncbi:MULTISPECIES: TetR/AcrR family transcriptional regulator [Pseudomonas]|jgi:AcrR family transcriptional regulator|uniref:TetR family transcriptional regulator n=1 Tax=Pseudomonas syringae group genomosp. 3 TaxID=251701 RepID=A0ABD6VHR2_9PSED|nr:MULTISPECIES: TetR/AcrR family transcriptional regulator [Pseudomonas]MCS3511055.1 AcrR family transcriptional regulator [Pseudomonas grimontii]POD73085.1 TetR family transcriptional regulator [Pseudomonas syringae group genomosp. 3]SEO02122.1 transcriptional regulator, TetR family [Pseudomonas sp. ok266]
MPQKTTKSTPAKPRSRSSIGAVRSPQSTEAILEAAAAILEEQGYRAFTMDALVERAGSSKPTIYRWWRSKGALLRDVYERAALTFVTSPDTGNLEQDLIEHLRSLWSWWRSSSAGETLRSFFIEIQLDSKAIAEFREEFLPRRERTLRKIFARAVNAGEIVDGPAVEVAVSMLTGMSWLHLVTANLENLDDIDNSVAVIVKGLRVR